MEGNKKNKYILIIGLIIVYMLFSALYSNALNKIEEIEIKYPEFLKMVDEGKVKSISMNKSNLIIVEDVDGEMYVTNNPKSIDFREKMLMKGVDIEEAEDKGELLGFVAASLLRVGTLLLMFSLIMKMQYKHLIPDKMFEPQDSTVKFSDIAGNNESKKDMELLVRFLKEPEKYKEMGAKLPKGVLFYGSPGTGKTLTAKAIAGEADVPFIVASGSDFVELYAGLGAKKIRELFAVAREKAPCIVFIDEIDALAGARGMGQNSEKDQTINALLAEMDGFSSEEGVIVMGATNRIETLDPAILRPGRLDRHIAIELPDLHDRKEILSLHARNKKIDKDINMDEIAKMTIGFSGASLASLLNEAAINAVNANRDKIILKDIDDAYIKMITKGHIKEKSDRSPNDTKLVAYHEAGHALLGKLLTNNDIPKVTITPTTSGAGGFTVNIPEKMGLLTKEDIQNEIITLYGGRAAEELLRGSKSKVTTGASNDIKQATKLIKGYFEIYGMSDKYGMLDLSQYDNKDALDEAVELSNNLYNQAYNTLLKNRETLDLIAGKLIDQETISGDELEEIMNTNINYLEKKKEAM